MTKAEVAELRKLWQARVAAFRASGQSGAAWCAAHQIKEHQLWYWIRRFPIEHSPQTSPAGWIPVPIHESAEAAGYPLQVRVGQATIEVRPGFDPALLQQVVRTLTAIC